MNGSFSFDGFLDPPSLSDVILVIVPFLGPIIWQRRKTISQNIHFNSHILYLRSLCLYGKLLIKIRRDNGARINPIIKKVTSQPLFYLMSQEIAKKTNASHFTDDIRVCEKCMASLDMNVIEMNLMREITRRRSVKQLLIEVGYLCCTALISTNRSRYGSHEIK